MFGKLELREAREMCISTEEWKLLIEVLKLLLSVAGGAFALLQWRKNNQLNRTMYADSMIEKLRSDDEIRKISNYFDYEDDWYDDGFYANKELEIKVDKTLSYYSYICYLVKMKIISKKEFSFFQYEIQRTVMNKSVQNYLYNYYHYSQNLNLANAYQYLMDFGNEMNAFPNDFYDKHAHERNGAFTKRLVF